MNDLYQSQDICMKFEVRDLGDLGLVTGGSGDLVFVGKSGDIFERTEVGNEEILQLDVRNNNEVVYVSENQINRLLFNDIN